MPIALDDFPFIRQRYHDWCIFASVANVLRYHGSDIGQEKIFCFHINEYGNDQPSLERMANAMRNQLGTDFEYIFRSDFQNGEELLEYAEQRVNENLPLIVSMRIEIRGEPRAHMLIILNITQDKIRTFDLGRGWILDWHRHELIQNLAGGLNTLLIKPRV